jgi:hypothetical protein
MEGTFSVPRDAGKSVALEVGRSVAPAGQALDAAHGHRQKDLALAP